MLIGLGALSAAMLLSFGGGFLVRRLLGIVGMWDRPNARSSHSVRTLRGGGLGIIGPYLVCLAVYVWANESSVGLGLLIAVLIVATVSLLDDIFSLSEAIRLAGHFLGSLVFLGILGLEWGEEAWWQGHRALFWFLALAWLVGYTNAFNFMDGINGLAALQAAITAGFTAMVVLHYEGMEMTGFILAIIVLAGAALGFAPHNFPRAQMFMGDIGSVSLGFILAATSVWAGYRYGWTILVPLTFIHANFVLDTWVTFLRRLIRGGAWWRPHREHFYQRLVRSGASHAQVTSIESILQGVAALFLWLYLVMDGPLRWLFPVCVLILWGGFFWYCEQQWLRMVKKEGGRGGEQSLAK